MIIGQQVLDLKQVIDKQKKDSPLRCGILYHTIEDMPSTDNPGAWKANVKHKVVFRVDTQKKETTNRTQSNFGSVLPLSAWLSMAQLSDRKPR